MINNFTLFQEMKNDLTPKENDIIEYIEKNSKEVIGLTITELSEKCNVSVSGVVRACKKMGFKGYQEFKIFLAQNIDIKNEIKYLQQDIETNDSIQDIYNKVFNATIQDLKDTVKVMSSDNMEQAVKMINSAKSISFFGVGGAGVVATDAYYRFSKLNIPCQAYIDSHNQINQALMMDKDSIIIAISHSGKTRDILISLDIAKKRGIKIIAITQVGNTPITKLADLYFFTNSKETAFRHDAMASRIVEITLLDSMFTCAAFKNYKNIVKYYDESWKVFRSMQINSIKELNKLDYYNN